MDFITSSKTKFTLAASLLLHLLAFLVIGIYFDFSSQSFLSGNPDVQTVSSYIYPYPAKKTSIASEKQLSPQPQPAKKPDRPPIEKATRKISLAQKTTTNASPPSSPQSPASNGQKTSELVALLHAAIQKHQRYPASALQMEREGRVTLKFTLHTNGGISGISILHSSGTDSLDEAALEAVHHAVPFRQVSHYLREAQEYRIDVVFELT